MNYHSSISKILCDDAHQHILFVTVLLWWRSTNKAVGYNPFKFMSAKKQNLPYLDWIMC